MIARPPLAVDLLIIKRFQPSMEIVEEDILTAEKKLIASVTWQDQVFF